jgi:hypothetical protein
MGKVFGYLGLGIGIGGMFLAILGIILLYAIGWMLGMLWIWPILICGSAIVFSAIGIAKDDSRGPGIAGLVISVVGVILSIVYAVLYYVVLAATIQAATQPDIFDLYYYFY